MPIACAATLLAEEPGKDNFEDEPVKLAPGNYRRTALNCHPPEMRSNPGDQRQPKPSLDESV
jgi:hypothetical protein